jgi:hypothetical protein
MCKQIPRSVADEDQSNLFFLEREYLRSLIHHHYEMKLDSICDEQVKFMASNPNSEVFITLFNYRPEGFVIEVHSAIEGALAADLRDTGAEWADMVARGTRSEGRLHLHVMQVPQGSNSRYWVIPLRTACSKLHDDLRVLAQGLSADVRERDRMKEIRAILEDARDVLAIH